MSERQERNRQVIDEFRANAGVVGGSFAGTALLLLTTTGARTGEERINPLAYLADGDRPVVFGFNGGRPPDPGWLHNVRAEPRVTVEVGAERFAAVARIVEGPERDRLYDAVIAEHPEFAGFAERSGRTIAVVGLERAG